MNLKHSKWFLVVLLPLAFGFGGLDLPSGLPDLIPKDFKGQESGAGQGGFPSEIPQPIEDGIGELLCKVNTANEETSKKAEEVKLIERVKGRLAKAATGPGFDFADLAKKEAWRVTVIEDNDTKNAVVMPGGCIIVYSGILKAAENEAALAAVLSHEMVHMLARHKAKRIASAISGGALGGLTTGVALSQAADLSPEQAAAAGAAVGLAAAGGALLAYAKADETQADHEGLLLMAQAGYDPRETLEFWDRIKSKGCTEGGEPPAFLSAHADYGERAEQLESSLEEANQLYQKSDKHGIGEDLQRERCAV